MRIFVFILYFIKLFFIICILLCYLILRYESYSHNCKYNITFIVISSRPDFEVELQTSLKTCSLDFGRVAIYKYVWCILKILFTIIL